MKTAMLCLCLSLSGCAALLPNSATVSAEMRRDNPADSSSDVDAWFFGVGWDLDRLYKAMAGN